MNSWRQVSALSWVLLGLHIAVTGFLLSVPLFQDFDYEFNEVLAALSVLTSAIWSIHVVRSAGENHVPLWMILKWPLVVLTITVSAMVLWTLVARGCCIERGLYFFLLLPLVGVLIGSGLGRLLVTLSPRFAFWMLAAVIGLSLCYQLWIVYRDVPIFVYSVFWGYFAGPVYDEHIPISPTLVTHRALAVLWAVSLWSLSAWIIGRRAGKTSAVVSTILGAGLLCMIAAQWFRSDLGFDISYASLEKTLSSRHQTKHVDVFFDPLLDDRSVELVAAKSEFFYQGVSRTLELKSPARIKVFVYRDSDQKKSMLGAGPTNFAKVWRSEIHINADDAPDVMAHEIVHVMASEFGHPLYSTLRLGFLEGLAVALDWSDPTFTPHQWAAILERIHRLPDVAGLIDGSSFFSGGSRLSYTVSGSFVRYVLDNYGAEKLKRIYHHERIDEVYGMTGDKLITGWKEFLASVPVDSGDLAFASILMEPGIFGRKCVHQMADLHEEARVAIRREEYQKGLQIYDRILSIDRTNSRALLSKARLMMVSGMASGSVALLDSIRPQLAYTSRATADLLRGDAWVLAGRQDSATYVYSQAEEHYRRLPSIYMSARGRLDWLAGADGRKVVERIILAALQDSLPDVGLDSNAYWRLRVGRWLAVHGDFRAPLSYLNTEVGDPMIDRIRLITLGECLVYAGDWDAALSVYDAALAKSSRENEQLDLMREISFITWIKGRPEIR